MLYVVGHTQSAFDFGLACFAGMEADYLLEPNDKMYSLSRMDLLWVDRNMQCPSLTFPLSTYVSIAQVSYQGFKHLVLIVI